jgi:hypothetical protein
MSSKLEVKHLDTKGKYAKTAQYAFGYGISLTMFIKRHPRLPLRTIKVIYKCVNN